MLHIKNKKEIEGTAIEDWFTSEHIKLFKSIELNLATQQAKDWQGELAITSAERTFFAFVNIVPFLDLEKKIFEDQYSGYFGNQDGTVRTDEGKTEG